MATVCPTTPRLDLVIPSASAYFPVAPAGIVVGPKTVNHEPPEDVTACGNKCTSTKGKLKSVEGKACWITGCNIELVRALVSPAR
jgi:hypothetical protein